MADGETYDPKLFGRLCYTLSRYAFWTREAIVFIVSGVLGRPEVIEQYKNVGREISEVFIMRYGSKIREKIARLIYERALTVIDMARAYTNENTELYDEAVKNLGKNDLNIIEYAKALAPSKNLETVKICVEADSGYISEQLAKRFLGDFEGEINAFEGDCKNILVLAGFLSD